MWVLLIYVALMAGFSLVDFGIGDFVSREWSDPVSLPVFLGCYFLSLWLGWKVAVKIAEKLRLED